MSEYKFNEDTLSEQPAIEQLKRLGHLHIHGDQLNPDLIKTVKDHLQAGGFLLAVKESHEKKSF